MQLIRIVLSTPKFFIISKATAVEALPDIGRININGSICDGTFIKFKKGDNKFWKSSKIPEFLSALTAKNNAISVGKILITVFIPIFCTVLRNCQKLLLFQNNHMQ